MATRALRLASVLLLSASTAQAQGWLDAYQRGDYATAAALLHREVIELPPGETFADAEATLQLGLLYAEGRGVEADPLMACAFVQLGHAAAMWRYHEQHPITSRAQQLVNEHCDRLSYQERREATELMACPVFGIKSQVFVLDSGYWIDVNRRRILIENRGVTFERSLTDSETCFRQFGLVRHVRVEPPPGTAFAARDFLEFVNWGHSEREGQSIRVLTWNVEEVKSPGSRSDVPIGMAHEVLVQEPGSTWPFPGLPAAIEQGATFRMLSTGDVQWEIASEPPRRGVIDRLR